MVISLMSYMNINKRLSVKAGLILGLYVSKDKMKRTLIEMFLRVEKHARHNHPSDMAIGVGASSDE